MHPPLETALRREITSFHVEFLYVILPLSYIFLTHFFNLPRSTYSLNIYIYTRKHFSLAHIRHSYLDLSDRRVEFTAAYWIRVNAGNRSLADDAWPQKKKKKGEGEEEKKGGRKCNSGEKKEKWGNSRVCDRFHYEIVGRKLL